MPQPHNLFIAVRPTCLMYCDRSHERHGDYLVVARLPYRELVLKVYEPKSVLLPAIREDVAQMQARRGEIFPTSVCGREDAAQGLATGQTVILGG